MRVKIERKKIMKNKTYYWQTVSLRYLININYPQLQNLTFEVGAIVLNGSRIDLQLPNIAVLNVSKVSFTDNEHKILLEV